MLRSMVFPLLILSGAISLSAQDSGPAATPATAAEVEHVASVATPPSKLVDLFGKSSTAQTLERRLQPYEQATAGKSLLQPLDGLAPDLKSFRFGSDFIVLAPNQQTREVSVNLPEGVWVNYWTGAQVLGGQTVSLELAADSYPMWVRGGSVIPLLNDPKPSKKRADTTAKNSDGSESSMVEVLPAYSDQTPDVAKDAGDRVFTREGDSLRIQGKDTHTVIRWRFTQVSDVRVNGTSVPVQRSPEGFYAAFDHTGTSTVVWKVRNSSESRYRY